QNLPFLSLESLPKESIYQILSHLKMKYRMRVRKCSTTMKEAIENSDLYADQVTISFEWNQRVHWTLFESVHKQYKLHAHHNDMHSLQNLLDNLSKSFRRVRMDKLKIYCNGMTLGHQHRIEQSTVDSLTAQFDFAGIHLKFDGIFQQTVMSFAIRSGRPIQYLALWNCDVDPPLVIGLPRTAILHVTQNGDGFSDAHALEIARREHTELQLDRCNFIEPSTLRHLIKIFNSSHLMEILELFVPSWYFDRFLASFGLR
ncbi:hypothetical protein PFISCL1PPCAC_25067, partial [Pristionchus fissidentatus]